MSSTFKEGDVVTRKTGGPLMTVEEIHPNDSFVRVVWFDLEQHVHRDAFAGVTLQKWQAVD